MNPQDALSNANPVAQHNVHAETEEEAIATDNNAEPQEINVQPETNNLAELYSDHRHSNRIRKSPAWLSDYLTE